MKKEYDLTKLKKRPGKPKVDTGLASTRIVRKSERRYFSGKESPERIAVLTGSLAEQGQANHTVAVVELPANARSSAHFHKEREESYFVLAGEGEVVIAGERFSISEGDLVSARPGESHQFIAGPNGSLQYLVITSPAWVPEDSFNTQ